MKDDLLMLLHDSHNPFFRQPAGPVPAGSTVVIRFQSDEASAVILRTWMKEELSYSMSFDGNRTYEAAVTLPEGCSGTTSWSTARTATPCATSTPRT